jgi:hypothetical protein
LVTVDVVVARVAVALGRGHALFSPAPLDAAAGLSGSSQTLTSLSNRIGASPQTLGAHGQFAHAYGDVAEQFSGRLSGTAALDARLSGLVSDAAAADAAGRSQSGNVVNAAAGDTARAGPYTNTAAGQRALLIALRDRVTEQRQMISAYKTRDANLAAMVRQLAYRRSAAGGGGGWPGMLSGLGGMRPPTTGSGAPGLAGLSMPNLSGVTTTGRGDHSSSSGGQIPIGPGCAVLLGELTPDSSPREVAAAIIHEARRRGYSPEQAIAIVSAGLQESGLRHRAVRPNRLWESYSSKTRATRAGETPTWRSTNSSTVSTDTGDPTRPTFGNRSSGCSSAPATRRPTSRSPGEGRATSPSAKANCLGPARFTTKSPELIFCRVPRRVAKSHD